MSKALTEFKRYLFEVLAIITAITLSFLFDEWREKRKDRRTNVELLSSLADDLKKDTFLLGQTIQFQKQVVAGEKHILRSADSLKADSVTLGMLGLQSYPTFRKTDVSYLTMIQTGNARVFTNKQLLDQITDLYQKQYKILDEWEEIERNFVLDKAIPYIITNIPHVRNYQYGSLVNNNPKFSAVLAKDEFKNLLNSDYLFKVTMIELYKSTQKSADSLLRNVDAEIKKLR
ncbi:MAG TPA: DUF6090 family protein [Chitinophagaceae bacterium]|nr:DUF6090 family protein [Chitinophagaceae bacterium]